MSSSTLNNKLLNILKWSSLISIFIICFFVINPYIFKAVTWFFEYILDAKVYWEKAPFLKGVFTVGVGIIFSWVVTKGIDNVIEKKPFFYNVMWGKLFVTVFCIVFWLTLMTEIENLVPEYKYDKNDDWDGSPLMPFKIVGTILTVIIGWALWRHVERYDKYWECQYCGTVNSAWLDECGNPNCAGKESSVEEDSEP